MSSGPIPSEYASRTPLSPVVITPRTTFGTVVSAMLIGALLAVTGLYIWGAQVAEQEANAQIPTTLER